ncbi:hypothetical protein Tco_0417041 [Tanacetum coccineum]
MLLIGIFSDVVTLTTKFPELQNLMRLSYRQSKRTQAPHRKAVRAELCKLVEIESALLFRRAIPSHCKEGESDPLHHEFVGEIITLPSRIAREHEEYLSLMTLLCEISTSRSPKIFHANPSSIIESLPASRIPIEDSDPVQEEIDIFLVPDDLIPPGVRD